MDIFNKIKTIRTIGIYTTSEVISKGLNWSLLLILFFLSGHNRESYGLLSILIAFESIGTVVLDFGQKRVIYRFYDNQSNNNEFLSSTFSSWMLITTFVITIFFIALLLSGCDTFFKIPIYGLFILELINLIMLNVINFMYALFRIKKDIIEYAKLILIISTIKFITTITASLLGSSVFNSYIIGTFTSLCFGIVLEFALLKNSVSFKIKKSIIKNNLNYGYPLILQQAISNIGPNIDKFFLTNFVSLAEIGVYNFVITITSAFSFFYSIGTSYFEPILFRTRENSSEFLKINNTFLHTTTLFSSIVILLTSLILFVINYNNISIYIIISIAYSFLPLYFYNTYVYMVNDHNMDVVKFSIISVVCIILADYYFIKSIGVTGAAYAQLIYTYILSWVSYIYMVHKNKSQQCAINKYMGISIIISLFLFVIIGSSTYLLIICIIYLLFCSYYIIKNKKDIYNSIINN